MVSIVKRSFLQACLNHGSLDVPTAITILNSLCEKYKLSAFNDEGLKELVEQINSDLKPYDQSVVMLSHPIAGKEFVVYCSTGDSKGNHVQEDDRQYFSMLIDIIVKTDDYSIDNMNIFNVSDLASGSQHAKSKSMTKSHMTELIDLWISQGYFLRTETKLYFGPRMIAELGISLRNQYAEYVHECPLCNKIIFWDINCGSCNTKIHRECIRKYLIRKSNCPACKATWNTRLSV